MSERSEPGMDTAEPLARGGRMDSATEAFAAHRNLLFTVAYEMLGSAADAEDVLQETWLRWAGVDLDTVRDQRAYLVRITTRQALSRLRTLRRRKESYIGPWLPEPVVGDPSADPQAAVTLADDVSFALLLVLERLSPLERAAFLLHDALDVPFAEIAATLGRSEAAVRQLASRARTHVRESGARRSYAREDSLRLRDALFAALSADDLPALQRLLTDDIVLLSDGGGKAVAALNPLAGIDRVSRFLQGITRKNGAAIRAVVPATINGAPGFVLFGEREVNSTFSFDVAEGKIAAIYIVRNPDKLRRLL